MRERLGRGVTHDVVKNSSEISPLRTRRAGDGEALDRGEEILVIYPPARALRLGRGEGLER
jgi:hypothetical protein